MLWQISDKKSFLLNDVIISSIFLRSIFFHPFIKKFYWKLYASLYVSNQSDVMFLPQKVSKNQQQKKSLISALASKKWIKRIRALYNIKWPLMCAFIFSILPLFRLQKNVRWFFENLWNLWNFLTFRKFKCLSFHLQEKDKN